MSAIARKSSSKQSEDDEVPASSGSGISLWNLATVAAVIALAFWNYTLQNKEPTQVQVPVVNLVDTPIYDLR